MMQRTHVKPRKVAFTPHLPAEGGAACNPQRLDAPSMRCCHRFHHVELFLWQIRRARRCTTPPFASFATDGQSRI